MTPAEYQRAYRARKRAARPPPPALADRATVGSLEQQRAAINLPGPDLSRALGKDRDWWRRVTRGRRLTTIEAAWVQAELTAALARANKAFNPEKP